MTVKTKIGNIIPLARVWLSKRELKEYLDCSDEWIEKFIYPNLHCYAVGNKKFFAVAEVDKFIKNARVT